MASSHALSYLKNKKADPKARLRIIIPWLLLIPLWIVWLKGFMSSLIRASEPAANANAYAQLIASRNAMYSQKVSHRLEKANRKILIECAHLAVHYSAAKERIKRIEDGIPGFDTESIRLRRIFRARTEREYLFNARTALRYRLSANMEAMSSLNREAEVLRNKFTARARTVIYQFIRGISR